MIDLNNPKYDNVIIEFAIKVHEYSHADHSLEAFFSNDREWIRSMIDTISKIFEKDYREVDNDIATQLDLLEEVASDDITH